MAALAGFDASAADVAVDAAVAVVYGTADAADAAAAAAAAALAVAALEPGRSCWEPACSM